MTEPIFSLWDIIMLLGYPLVGWLAWKGGQTNGVTNTVAALQDAGLLSEDFGKDDEEDEEE